MSLIDKAATMQGKQQTVGGELVWENRPRWGFWGVHGNQLLRVVWCLLVAGLLGATAYQLWQWRELKNQNQEWDRKIQTLRQQSNAQTKAASTKTTSSAASPMAALQRQQVQALLRQLNMLWQQLLQQLEDATPSQVALISLEPDAQRGTLKLQAEARQIDTLLQFAASLQNQGVLGALSYGKHETNEHDPQKPARLSFELQIRFNKQSLIESDRQPD